MRTIIISKQERYDNSEPSDTVRFQCKDFSELDKYIRVAQRMRPDRIIIEYHEYI